MGDMLELGQVEGALHREAGKRAASMGVNLLVAVGTLSRQSAESARRGGVQEVHLHPGSKTAAGSRVSAVAAADGAPNAIGFASVAPPRSTSIPARVAS